MAGGAGIEWYFGYNHPHSDLTCQDFRSRDKMWDQCRYALEFFKKNNIPFWEMKCDDSLTKNPNDYCFFKQGEVYVIYCKNGRSAQMDILAGRFTYGWFNPRNGDGLNGLIEPDRAKGPYKLNVAAPDENDWVLLIKGTGTIKASADEPSLKVTNSAMQDGFEFDMWQVTQH